MRAGPRERGRSISRKQPPWARQQSANTASEVVVHGGAAAAASVEGLQAEIAALTAQKKDAAANGAPHLYSDRNITRMTVFPL